MVQMDSSSAARSALPSMAPALKRARFDQRGGTEKAADLVGTEERAGQGVNAIIHRAISMPSYGATPTITRGTEGTPRPFRITL